MDKLSQMLWRERELLDDLAYQLEVERLLLAGGRARWLVNAARAIETTLDRLRYTEVLRAVAADEAAESLGLAPHRSLAALAGACDEPWRGILLEHRECLLALVRDIADLSQEERGLVTPAYRSAQETLLATADVTYLSRGPDGARRRGERRVASLLDFLH